MPPAEILDLPCAHGGAVGDAKLRASPEDFVVREWLGFDPDGDGEHLLLKVRKRDANTLWIAKQLARLGKIHPSDVGFAGLKDRHAVAEQAFTLPARAATATNWVGLRGDGFEVLAATRHRRKLKRGALRGNDFEVVLRSFSGDIAALEQRLRTIAVAGIPNYFGPQRFGRDGSNLRLARSWFAAGTEPRDRSLRSFALSAARAVIFNTVLAQRIRDGTWNQLQPGDIANLDGSGSIFVVNTVDEALHARCARLDVHPTGPLWGVAPPPVAGVAAIIEQRAAERHPELSAGLSRVGLEAERRALRARVDPLDWTLGDGDVRLRFRLPRGAFATALLHELLAGAFAQDTPEADV